MGRTFARQVPPPRAAVPQLRGQVPALMVGGRTGGMVGGMVGDMVGDIVVVVVIIVAAKSQPYISHSPRLLL